MIRTDMINNPLEFSESLSLLSNRLKDKGLFLDIGNNQREFEQLVEASEKPKVGENLNLEFNSLGPANFFYLCVQDETSENVGLIAARKDNLGGRTLGNFLSDYLTRIYTASSGRPQMQENHAMFASKPMGEIAYVGELWVHPKLRDLVIARTITQMTILLSVLHWNCEFTYAFLTDKHMRKGAGVQYGWTRSYVNALRWQIEPKEIPTTLGCVAITQEEVCDLARQIIAGA